MSAQASALQQELKFCDNGETYLLAMCDMIDRRERSLTTLGWSCAQRLQRKRTGCVPSTRTRAARRRGCSASLKETRCSPSTGCWMSCLCIEMRKQKPGAKRNAPRADVFNDVGMLCEPGNVVVACSAGPHVQQGGVIFALTASHVLGGKRSQAAPRRRVVRHCAGGDR